MYTWYSKGCGWAAQGDGSRGAGRGQQAGRGPGERQRWVSNIGGGDVYLTQQYVFFLFFSIYLEIFMFTCGGGKS